VTSTGRPVVLITGAGTGVGRGMALAFAEAGFAVVVSAHHEETGQRVAAEIAHAGGAGVCVETDVTDPTAIRRAIDTATSTFGRLDAMVHNAVSARSNEPVDLESASMDLFAEHAAVSMRAAYHCALLAWPHLAESGGALLLLQSPAGIQGSERLSLYAVMKGFQRGFVKSLAREWGADGIRVNGLAPLAMTSALEAAFRNDATMEPRLTNMIPAGRFGDPKDDIGPPAVFLCSDAARYITGQTLVVSGGRFTAL
jgi:NAD(P)-dependent dehydrogenase (short-subunit alcohol dehydrogenase family)